MATCNECKQYFLMDENPDRGDCVQRVVDELPLTATMKVRKEELRQRVASG